MTEFNQRFSHGFNTFVRVWNTNTDPVNPFLRGTPEFKGWYDGLREAMNVSYIRGGEIIRPVLEEAS